MSSLSSLSSDDDTTTTEEEEEEARIELEEARTELEAARKEMKNAIEAHGELPFAALPSDDDGLVELPSDDCDDGGASSSQGIAKRRRLWTAIRNPRGDRPSDVIPGPSAGDSLAAGGPRGDHPRDVIPGPSAGDSLAAGDIDLPEEVANDELDDLFVDVTTASPKKEDRYLAKTLRGKKKHVRRRVFPGPTPADIQTTVVQGRAPDVEADLSLPGGALQDDVMEVFSPPRILEHTATLGLRGDLSADLATGWDLSLEQDRGEPPPRDRAAAAENCVPGTPLHLVLQALELELEAYPSASSRATSSGSDCPLRVLPPDHAHPAARWPGFRPRAPAESDFVETPAGPGCTAQVSWYRFC